jgi:hypothetical protein
MLFSSCIFLFVFLPPTLVGFCLLSRWVGPKAAKPASLAQLTPRQVAEFRASGEVHKWMYDRYSLSVLVKQARFQQPGPDPDPHGQLH